jgi:broad specificity phosphatase PhoE
VLILVRHATPAHGPDTPAHAWPLSPRGEVEARALCARLPTGARLVSSSEPKAIATLKPLGAAIPDPRFAEVSRVEAYADTYRATRRAFVEGTDHPGWEARTDVVRRFQAGVDEHVTAAAGPVIIASHGMAITLWLSAIFALDDPGAFWADLRFPDAHAVDLGAATLTRFVDD